MVIYLVNIFSRNPLLTCLYFVWFVIIIILLIYQVFVITNSRLSQQHVTTCNSWQIRCCHIFLLLVSISK